MFEKLQERAKTKVDVEKSTYYYTLVDCCSGESYVYPQGHFLAGYPVYFLYDGNYNEYSPTDIIQSAEIITSIEDSLGFKITGCLLLKPADAPIGNPPINLQNWYDVMFNNLVTTPMCCDCNSSCNSLFFQFLGFAPDLIEFGQLIFGFTGPTGTYLGKNYYEIIIGTEYFYVWYSTSDQVWYLSNALGSLPQWASFTTQEPVPAVENVISDWASDGKSRFQSYICKAPEPVVAPSEYKYPEERYQLTCCSTGEALKVNGLPGVFVFQGVTSNNNHPDDFLEVVLTTIKDINGNVVTGCYRLTEAECFEEWEEIIWNDFFVQTECVKTCEECLPKPVIIPPITNHKTIYPDYKINNVDPYEAEKIYCAFGDANYQKVLALRFGVQFCCPTDLMQSTIEHEILKMDIAEDVNACCPVTPLPGTCKKYEVTIPSDKEGYLYFKDCSGNVRIVQFHNYGSSYMVYVCGITAQTNQDIYALVNNNEILQLTFTEGVDCD